MPTWYDARRLGLARRPGVRAGLLLVAALGSCPLWPAVGDEPTAGSRLTIVDDGQHLSVRQGPQLLLRYRYAGSSHKPYVDQLTTPRGINVVRDAPADHLHHHGWMLAFKVDGVNFWEEVAGAGRQMHQEWRSTRTVTRPGELGEWAELHQQLHWVNEQGGRLLDEERCVQVASSEDDAPRLATWRSTFTVPPGSRGVTLTGANYHGLGVRFLQSMDRGGQFLNSTGGRQVEGTNGQHAAWCAYIAEPTAGQPVTVAMFDSPTNPRHAARWFTMQEPFAYLSASLRGDTDPWRLEPGQRITLTYGMVLLDGKAEAEALESLYARWKDSLVNPS